jgi:hypothetical protein
MDSDKANKVILYLIEKGKSVKLIYIMQNADPPNFIQDGTIIINQLTHIGVVEKTTGADKVDRYFIPERIQAELRTLADEFTAKPYEYFVQKHTREVEAESQHKWYLRTDAKQRFDDYPKARNQKIFFMVVAIIELILLLLQWLKPSGR